MQKALIITFHTQADSMAAMKTLKGITKGRLIPTPRIVSSGCGYAWCDSTDSRTTVLEALRAHKIDFAEECIVEL